MHIHGPSLEYIKTVRESPNNFRFSEQKSLLKTYYIFVNIWVNRFIIIISLIAVFLFYWKLKFNMANIFWVNNCKFQYRDATNILLWNYDKNPLYSLLSDKTNVRTNNESLILNESGREQHFKWDWGGEWLYIIYILWSIQSHSLWLYSYGSLMQKFKIIVALVEHVKTMTYHTWQVFRIYIKKIWNTCVIYFTYSL